MFDEAEEKILKNKFYCKRANARKEGIDFSLSLDQFRYLVEQANLLPSQLGYSGDMYVLARYNDDGAYELGNCRFITQKENMAERGFSEAARAVSQMNCIKMNQMILNNPQKKEERRQKFIIALRESESYKKRLIEKERKRIERDAKKDPRYSGSKNSMYGAYWITDNEHNIFWRDEKGPLPPNYHRGRVMKKIVRDIA